MFKIFSSFISYTFYFYLLLSFFVKWYFIQYFTHLWIHCPRFGSRDELEPMTHDSDDHCELSRDKNMLIWNWKLQT